MANTHSGVRIPFSPPKTRSRKSTGFFTYYLLLITYYLLLIVYYSLFITHCLLLIVYCFISHFSSLISNPYCLSPRLKYKVQNDRNIQTKKQRHLRRCFSDIIRYLLYSIFLPPVWDRLLPLRIPPCEIRFP